MNTYDGIPREQWLDGLSKLDNWNARHILSVFSLIGIPNSYLDVGCGTGKMVRTADRLGAHAYGVDQLVDSSWPDNFFHGNLTEKFELPKTIGPVELVTCLEVAEHIPLAGHDTLCDTLVDNLKVGHYFLLFSSARPGQKGEGHIACRPAEDWHKEFAVRGMAYNKVLTMNLALLWSYIDSPLGHLADNLIVFERG